MEKKAHTTANSRPNIILVMTDDQGHGDLGCHGNPWIKTPEIDKFHSEAARCRNFHVSPLCTPTRGALLTGRNPLRNGAWGTCWGRSILHRNETTMADILSNNGYKTGMFGKWHLGDNYPYRPQDRGFQEVVAHKGGGVGQTPDFWGNNYFDDTYFYNNEPQTCEGYCTDVWFSRAFDFIEKNRHSPFFCYISTNAPHAPYLVADKYSRPYRKIENIPSPEFYGMISNIDENFGKLERKLCELGIKDNTILIFMTDNGSSAGCNIDENHYITKGYNSGMRGRKASYYEGGHRVPFFFRWPDGGIQGGIDIDELTTHMDLLPTLIDLCGLDTPGEPELEGENISELLKGREKELPDRCITVQYRQHTDPPKKWNNAIISGRWRLVKGQELYDVEKDPGQRRDVACDYPEVAERLRASHERYWDEVSPQLEKRSPIFIGNKNENPTCLTAMDVMGDVAWNQCHIVKAIKSTGKWWVKVEEKGLYRFGLRRWPTELGLPIDRTIGREEAEEIAPYNPIDRPGIIYPSKAKIKIFNTEKTVDLSGGEKEAVIETELSKTGETELEAWFMDSDGEHYGAYYVYVSLIRKDAV